MGRTCFEIPAWMLDCWWLPLERCGFGVLRWDRKSIPFSEFAREYPIPFRDDPNFERAVVRGRLNEELVSVECKARPNQTTLAVLLKSQPPTLNPHVCWWIESCLLASGASILGIPHFSTSIFRIASSRLNLIGDWANNEGHRPIECGLSDDRGCSMCSRAYELGSSVSDGFSTFLLGGHLGAEKSEAHHIAFPVAPAIASRFLKRIDGLAGLCELIWQRM